MKKFMPRNLVYNYDLLLMLFYDTLSFGRYDGREHAWVDYEDNKRKTSLLQLHSSCKKKNNQ